ncbi:MAG: hypothetical protein RLZ81_112 [Pseudomonadota bacterium]|jgi:hypothetical protein
MNHDRADHEEPPSLWRSRYAIGLIVIGAVAGYFLLTEHLAHVVGALPILLLLACPLMHVFMHHGNGGHGHHDHGGRPQAGSDKSTQSKPGDPT